MGDQPLLVSRAEEKPIHLGFVPVATATCERELTQALSKAELALAYRTTLRITACTAAASAALLGREAHARKAMARLRELDPALRLSNLVDFFPIRRLEDLAHWREGLRRAGLPE